MANLTITVDDEVLRRARIRAVELGTSVNAVLREYMEQWTRVHEDRSSASSADNAGDSLRVTVT